MWTEFDLDIPSLSQPNWYLSMKQNNKKWYKLHYFSADLQLICLHSKSSLFTTEHHLVQLMYRRVMMVNIMVPPSRWISLSVSTYWDKLFRGNYRCFRLSLLHHLTVHTSRVGGSLLGLWSVYSFQCSLFGPWRRWHLNLSGFKQK